MRERIFDAIKSRNAYIEVRIEKRESNRIRFRGRSIDEISASSDLGGFIRALAPNGGWGVVTFNRIEELEKRVKDAIELSRSIVPKEEIKLADVEPVDVKIKEEIKDDFRKYTLLEKKAVIENYNDILLSHSDYIIDTTTAYADSFLTTYYANTDGTYIEKERADCLVMIGAIARKNGNVQQAWEARSSRVSFGDLKGLDGIAKEVAERATKLLDAEPVKAGRYTVILDNFLAGVFIHEAFGHLSEADHIFENP
ncbi:MAG: TldD/PmbA family protein, partial [bacterium]